MPQTKHDSGDEDYIRIPKTNEIDSNLTRTALLWGEICSKIHGLDNANDPNSQGRQSGDVLGSLLAQEEPKEDIDPKENRVGGKIAAGGRYELTHGPYDDGRLPEPIVKKYRTRVSADDEDSTRHVAHFLKNKQSSESNSRVPGVDNSTVISRIRDASENSKCFIPMPTADSPTRTRRYRAQGSPDKIAASPPAPPSSQQSTPNTSQGLSNQQCRNRDQYYHALINGSRYGAGECSTCAGRIRGSHIDMLEVSGLVGGDEALFFGRNDIEFTRDETEILGEEFSRNPPIASKTPPKQLSDRPTAIRPAVEGDARNPIAQSRFNQFSLGLLGQTENSSEPSRSESAHLGSSTRPRSTLPVAHAKAFGQLGPSIDSRPSLGKAVTQHNHEASLIRLSRSSSPSLGSVESYQTGGEEQFPEKTGFSEDPSFGLEADVSEAVETNPATRILNFGDDLYQVDISNSVGEDTEDMSHEGDPSQPSRALFSRMSQAEAIHCKLLKPLQSSSAYFDQPDGQSENMSTLEVEQGGAPGGTLLPETKTEALQTKITQLEAEVEFLSKLEREHRLAKEEEEALVFYWKEEYTEARQTVQDLEDHIETLETEVRRAIEKGEAQARSHSAMLHKLNYHHKQELLQHKREVLTIQQEHFKHNERKDKKHLEETLEKDRAVAHLRRALEMVEHLQSELEVMVNPMLVGRSS